MTKYEKIMEKTYQAMNAVALEMKKARDYGNGITLYHSEIHALETIRQYMDSNVSELAGHMAVTVSAVWQVAKKLKAKGLIESYRLKENRKEVYFSLNESGRIASEGHTRHHDSITRDSKALWKS
jgi:DNA-binding MarR family transcriptional regulator